MSDPAPWMSYPEGDPRNDPANWNGAGQYTGAYVDGWMPEMGYGEPDSWRDPYAPAQPAYNITGGGDYTGGPVAPPPVYGTPVTRTPEEDAAAWDTYNASLTPTYTGTPGTGSNMASPYNPATVAAGEQAAYETLLANGGIPLVGGTTAATDPYAGVPATDPYAAPAASTDPYTGLPVYEPAYSVSEPYSASQGYSGADQTFGATYPYPSFGQSAMNPGRQQAVVPGQFDPFAWSGNPNPMPAPNETRQMILGAMQLGAEIEQQRNQQPVMNATNYALHRLGLNKPEEPTPQMPVTPPPRSRFGGM